MATIIPLTFDDQPILTAQGSYTSLNGGDVARYIFINGLATESCGFSIAGGSNTTNKPTGITTYPSGGDYEAISGSWRWETDDLDVVQSQWALFPYDDGSAWTDVYCYAEEIQAPRSDPLFAGSQQNLSWLGSSSSFDTWLSLSSDQQYTWVFQATGNQNGGNGSPLHWYAQFDMWIYSDLLGSGAPTNPPASQGQVTNLGRVELIILNSTP